MENTGNTPKSPNPPDPEVRKEVDPKKYFSAFRNSTGYQKGFTEYFANKTLSPDVTEDEKRDVYEGSELAKGALLDFARNELHYSYDPSKFDKETSRAIDEYVSTVKDYFKILSSGDRVDIENIDYYRTMMHTRAARTLADNGYVPNERFGKALSRLVLIDKGLDTYENAAINDLERTKRMMGSAS